MDNQYEDRIIAFIDILGFRAIINETFKNDVVNQENLNQIVSVLKYIKAQFRKIENDAELSHSFVINFFSDSIVFSIKKYDTLSLLPIFELLKRIQINLIKHGVLLRGGVVFGKLIHTQEQILGPAMNDAYDLESKSALYPRITIDPEIMEMGATDSELSDGLFPIKDFDFHKTFDIDFDNTYYIDYFSDVSNYLDSGDQIEYYKNLRYLIRKGVDRKDIGIRMKYLWMLRKFNLGKPEKIRQMSYKELDELNDTLIGKSKIF